MSNTHDHTVAALSTPAGESGIAVVRLSGSQALEILAKVYRTTGSSPHTGAWEHRRLYHGFLQGAGTEAIDEVVCAVMRAPESYTGEDVVEISCHGNTLLVSRILEALFAAGARPAPPGEFTKRAFLNGKLDLIQAEAVADLIHSRSELQQKVAREQLAGTLSRRINDLAREMLDHLGSSRQISILSRKGSRPSITTPGSSSRGRIGNGWASFSRLRSWCVRSTMGTGWGSPGPSTPGRALFSTG
jgi:tRNA U34 5-carboxymethylaminomethyl modifying GTPase MnmE/TrmE